MFTPFLTIAFKHLFDPAERRITVFAARPTTFAEAHIALRTIMHLITATVITPRYLAPSQIAFPLKVFLLVADAGSAEVMLAVRAEFEVLHFLVASADRFLAPVTRGLDTEPARRVRQLSLTAIDAAN